MKYLGRALDAIEASGRVRRTVDYLRGLSDLVYKVDRTAHSGDPPDHPVRGKKEQSRGPVRGPGRREHRPPAATRAARRVPARRVAHARADTTERRPRGQRPCRRRTPLIRRRSRPHRGRPRCHGADRRRPQRRQGRRRRDRGLPGAAVPDAEGRHRQRQGELGARQGRQGRQGRRARGGRTRPPSSPLTRSSSRGSPAPSKERARRPRGTRRQRVSGVRGRQASDRPGRRARPGGGSADEAQRLIRNAHALAELDGTRAEISPDPVPNRRWRSSTMSRAVSGSGSSAEPTCSA